jgi:hypothetical protein
MMGSLRGAAAALLVAALFSPANAQQCINDYERALQALKKNAGECAKHNKLMTALTDAAGVPDRQPGWSGIDTGNFRRDSPHDFQAIVPAAPDYRWRFDGGKVLFNCTVPLSPRAMPQNEAFLECARVYACASAAAACGIATARATGSKDCKGITEQCMASHPIPQGTMGPVVASAAPAAPAAGPGTSAPRTQPHPQQQMFQQMSPQCQAQLNRMLEGADANDRGKAVSAYAGLRAECDAQIRRAAEAAQVGLPERVLSARAQGAMAKAMSGDPGRLAEAYADRAYDGQFDVDQVINFAFALLNLLSGIAGVYAAIPSGGYYAAGGGNFSTMNPRVRSTYGQGAPSGPPPPANRSTITGIK